MTTAVVAVLLLSAVVPAAGALASPPSSSPPAQFDGGAVHQQSVETDSVRLIISVAENGSATWSVQYWTRLDDENTSDAFESLQSDIRSNPSNFSDRFASRMRSTVTSAENATGREMSATDFGVRAETRTPPEYGVIIYTFQWEHFAAVDGDTVRVGDAIEGLFLDQRTRLVIEWPSSYALAEATPDPDERRDGAVVWRGSETSFVSGEPSVVLRPASAMTDAGTTDSSGIPASTLLVAVALLLVVGVVGWRYRDQFGGDDDDGAAAPGTANTTASGTAETADASAPSEDLLSNEERVLQFVREQGGRVKQQEIVEAFDWTEARTSQIVRDLREQGDLEGFRLGRENVLKLPDADSEAEE